MRTNAKLKNLVLLTAVLCAFSALTFSSPALAAHAPTITVSKHTATIGDRVTVRGKNFKPRKKYVLTVNNVKVASGKADKRGKLRVTLTVPQDATEALPINVTCGGASAATTVAVTNGAPNANGPDDNGDEDRIEWEDDDGSDSGDDGPSFSIDA